MYNFLTVIPGLQHLQLLAKQTEIGQSRTSVLNPLQWSLAILLFGLAALIEIKASNWLIAGLAICVFGNASLLAASYIYFMRKNPDALRSEGFSLQKMAIERGMYGDNVQGPRTIDAPSAGLITTQRGQKLEQEQQGS